VAGQDGIRQGHRPGLDQDPAAVGARVEDGVPCPEGYYGPEEGALAHDIQEAWDEWYGVTYNEELPY
jgi:hypothetical protein